MAFTQLAAEVPFYAGITLDEIGGRGVRWPARNAALWPQGDSGPFGLEMPPYAPTPNGSLRLGTYRSIWASPEVDVAPALKFLAARQIVELNPADAARLGVDHGDRVAAGADGRRVIGKVHLRSDAPAGTAFLQTGTARGLRSRAARRRSRGDHPRMTVLADINYVEPWWMQILKSLVIFLVIFQFVPVVLMADRKVLGRFQQRYGPNRVGPFGALQPIADILKLLGKEDFRTWNSVAFLHRIAPILSVIAAAGVVAVVPFGPTTDIFGTETGLYGMDVSIGPLWVFALSAVAFYGLMLGGWASGSKYSFLGSMRAAAQLISYEVAQGLSLVGVIMTAGTLSLVGIVEGQAGMWYFIPQFVGFIIFLVATLAETNRPPFDLAEADAELVQGYMTEYGGSKFGAYYMAEYLNMIVASLLIVTFFLGGWWLPFGIDPPTWVYPIVVLGKMLIFVYLFIWVRATLPRPRYDQLMSLGWKVLLPLATLNALVTAIIVVVTD